MLGAIFTPPLLMSIVVLCLVRAGSDAGQRFYPTALATSVALGVSFICALPLRTRWQWAMVCGYLAIMALALPWYLLFLACTITETWP